MRRLTRPIPWEGSDLRQRESWQHSLTSMERRELADAVAASADTPLGEIAPSTFPLDCLVPRLTQIREELHHGTGVAKLSGLPVTQWDEHKLQRAYIGLSTFLGTPTVQNRGEDLLREIRDQSRIGGTRVDSADALNWHNDRTDIVGLLCLSEAATGGVSRIASAIAIHNHLARADPESLRTLFGDFARYAPGDEVGGSAGIHYEPVFRYADGTLSTHYSRTYIRQAAAQPDGTPLSQTQSAALDALVDAAETLAFEMPLRAGEIQYLNNHAILHGRTAFSDQERHSRRLWRIWLSTHSGQTWRS